MRALIWYSWPINMNTLSSINFWCWFVSICVKLILCCYLLILLLYAPSYLFTNFFLLICQQSRVTWWVSFFNRMINYYFLLLFVSLSLFSNVKHHHCYMKTKFEYNWIKLNVVLCVYHTIVVISIVLYWFLGLTLWFHNRTVEWLLLTRYNSINV